MSALPTTEPPKIGELYARTASGKYLTFDVKVWLARDEKLSHDAKWDYTIECGPFLYGDGYCYAGDAQAALEAAIDDLTGLVPKWIAERKLVIVSPEQVKA